MHKYANLAGLTGVVWLVFLVGCAGTAFRRAEKAGTIRAYSSFTRKHPNSEHAAEANERIEALYYERAKAAKEDKRALDKLCKDYFQRYPEGEYGDSLRTIVEEADYDSANKKNTVVAYEDYIKRYPAGAFVRQARKRMETAVYQQVVTKGNVPSLKSYLQTYPNGSYVQAARNRLDQFEKKWYPRVLASRNCGVMKHFLAAFPDSEHRREIEEEMARFVERRAQNDLLISYEALGWPKPMTGKVAHDKATENGMGLSIIGRTGKHLVDMDMGPVYVLHKGALLPGDIDPAPAALEVEFFGGTPVSNEPFLLTSLDEKGIQIVNFTACLPVGTRMAVGEVMWEGVNITEGTIEVAQGGLVLQEGATYYGHADQAVRPSSPFPQKDWKQDLGLLGGPAIEFAAPINVQRATHSP